MTNGQMTIEDLAVIVKGGFDEVGERFDRVESRLDRVEDRLDSIEAKLIFIQQEIQDIKAELEHLSKRTFEDDKVITSEIVTMQERISVLEDQVRRLQASQS